MNLRSVLAPPMTKLLTGQINSLRISFLHYKNETMEIIKGLKPNEGHKGNMWGALNMANKTKVSTQLQQNIIKGKHNSKTASDSSIYRLLDSRVFFTETHGNVCKEFS